MKKAYSVPGADMGDCFNEPAPGSVRLNIGGLRQVGDGVFELHGVEVREIDWVMMAQAMGRKVMPDALAREIDAAAFRYDVAEILAERMERAA